MRLPNYHVKLTFPRHDGEPIVHELPMIARGPDHCLQQALSTAYLRHNYAEAEVHYIAYGQRGYGVQSNGVKYVKVKTFKREDA